MVHLTIPAELMELHISQRDTDLGCFSLDCNIPSSDPVTIKYMAWLDPNGTELCKVNDLQHLSGPCEYVPQKKLTLNLESHKTGNYSCKILSNRGIKTSQVEVNTLQVCSKKPSTDAQKRNSSSVCGPGLAWVGLLVTLLVMCDDRRVIGEA